jgi:hypothetical protein
VSLSSFSSRESEIRTLGKHLEAGVAKGESLSGDVFDRMLRLPRSDMYLLKDTILSLCDARLGGGDTERITRLQNCGARTIRYFGLAFDEATINEDFVPRLLAMSEGIGDLSPRLVGVRRTRYERLAAISQLAPRIGADNLDDVFQGALELAGYEGKFEPDLLLPLGNFERAYRAIGDAESESYSRRCQLLCLDAIRSVFEITVQALAEVDEKSLSHAIGILSFAKTAGVALLAILPSVAQNEEPACIDKMVEILDHSEWLLSRGEHYPGNYLNREEIQRFDRVRSILSLSAAMISMNCELYHDDVQKMRVAKREGYHLLGTAALAFARGGNGEEDVAFVRNLVLQELRADAAPGGLHLNQESMLEVAALAWHLNINDSPYLTAAIERVRDPWSQFYLTKALEGAPWE